tara:strand:- start:1069 stop:1479 length:411 start_codon:yes stop_codon:yes gene_type:complete
MKNNERTKLENAILDELNGMIGSAEWKYWDTGGGFSALVWEGADSHIVVTDNEDDCMAPTTWDHELMVGHYVGDTTGQVMAFLKEGDTDLDSGIFIVKGKEKFFDLVQPIMEQDCKQDGGHRDTGRGDCAECGTFL